MVLILSPAKCLVPSKDFLAFWALIRSLLVLVAVHVVCLKPDTSLQLPESMGSSLNDCVKKSATLCTLYCIVLYCMEMRISVEPLITKKKCL